MSQTPFGGAGQPEDGAFAPPSTPPPPPAPASTAGHPAPGSPPWTPAPGQHQAPGQHPPGQYPPGPPPAGQYPPGQYPPNQYPPGQYPPGPGQLYAALNAPRPGIVPLRPLGLGDVLDGIIKVVRRYPAATLGTAALIATVATLTNTVAQVLLQRPASAPGLGTILVASAAWLVAVTANALLAGIIINPVECGLLGQPASFGDSWRRGLNRLPQLLGHTLLIGLGMGLLVAVAIAPVAALGSLVDEGFYILFVLTVPLLLVAVAFVSVRFFLGAPSIVAERLGPVQALHRGWQLSRGAFWPLLGTMLLVGIILYFIYFVISLPFTVLAMVFGVTAFSSVATAAELPLSYYAVVSIGSIIASTIIYPFSSSTVGLLYFDQRIRKEGLDVELARRAAVR